MFNQIKSELESLDSVNGLHMSDLLEFPQTLSQLLTWMVREKTIQLEELAAYVERDQTDTRALLELLISKGFVEEVKKEDEEQYQVHMKPTRNYRVPKSIWQVLDN